MISLKQFVTAIHDAVLQASDSLRDRNVSLLDRYFEESPPDENGKKNLIPKSVVLEFHSLSSDGTALAKKAQVPLITLIPITLSRIEKATLTSDFEMELADGELQLEFSTPGKGKSALGGIFGSSKPKNGGRLEIVITPQDTPEGLRVVVEAYEMTLKRQLS